MDSTGVRAGRNHQVCGDLVTAPSDCKVNADNIKLRSEPGSGTLHSFIRPLTVNKLITSQVF
jgi:hypothetical protein